MPIQAVIDFMRIPLNIGGFSFSLFEFNIALLTMSVVITAIWRFFDD